ncbi:MAG TPA: TIM barrel protein, partial [Lentisphaeria bacterium]|nr:TIM barrel protein [Lentisphaeria bacterium]
MYFTGFADEAAKDLTNQIKATKTLGWTNIEARAIDGVNIHNLPEERFEQVVDELEAAGVKVNCFGSTIANWGKKITEPFDSSLEEINRAIPRMKRLGTKLVRVMSFARLDDREPNDQMEEERFRRLRELTKMFLDQGMQPVHENCMNYGGMGWPFTLKMLDNVPGLKLVF